MNSWGIVTKILLLELCPARQLTRTWKYVCTNYEGTRTRSTGHTTSQLCRGWKRTDTKHQRKQEHTKSSRDGGAIIQEQNLQAREAGEEETSPSLTAPTRLRRSPFPARPPNPSSTRCDTTAPAIVEKIALCTFFCTFFHSVQLSVTLEGEFNGACSPGVMWGTLPDTRDTLAVASYHRQTITAQESRRRSLDLEQAYDGFVYQDAHRGGSSHIHLHVAEGLRVGMLE